jgi:hypothetical protein
MPVVYRPNELGILANIGYTISMSASPKKSKPKKKVTLPPPHDTMIIWKGL